MADKAVWPLTLVFNTERARREVDLGRASRGPFHLVFDGGRKNPKLTALVGEKTSALASKHWTQPLNRCESSVPQMVLVTCHLSLNPTHIGSRLPRRKPPPVSVSVSVSVPAKVPAVEGRTMD